MRLLIIVLTTCMFSTLPQSGHAARIWYNVHVEDIGWMGWVKDGEVAGTTGKGK